MQKHIDRHAGIIHLLGLHASPDVHPKVFGYDSLLVVAVGGRGCDDDGDDVIVGDSGVAVDAAEDVAVGAVSVHDLVAVV